MKCLMCGRADAGESDPNKAKRLKACRRCRDVDAGAIERSQAELDGDGQSRQAFHGLVMSWLRFVHRTRLNGLRKEAARLVAAGTPLGQVAARVGAHLGIPVESAALLLETQSLESLSRTDLADVLAAARGQILQRIGDNGVTIEKVVAMREFRDRLEAGDAPATLESLVDADLSFVARKFAIGA